MSGIIYRVLTKTLNVVQLLFLNANKKPNKTSNQYIDTCQENCNYCPVNCNPNPSNKGTDCFIEVKAF